MDTDAIAEYVRKNPVFFLATEADGQPRTRAMMLTELNERGIIFHTGTRKAVNQDLLGNPRVELCFFDEEANTQLRLRGRVDLLEDQALKQRMVEQYDFLKPWVRKEGWGYLTTYALREGEARFWRLADNFNPPEPTLFRFDEEVE